jgi:glycine cleavage system regulatory protein
MKCVLAGSRYFGATVLEKLRLEEGVEFICVIAPAADDRLALAAKAAGLPVHILTNPKVVPGDAIPDGTDLIIAAHTHARVSDEALARSRLGGVGFHPSLLPRHRGIAAVEWTILEGDPIAGGSVYHLADGWDAGAIAAQDWCFVVRGESARELWERALAPMGLDLLGRVVRHARDHGTLPATPQDARFATRAPMIRRAVVVSDDAPAATTSLVVTVMGPDRPGIVRMLSDRAQRFGANWSASQLSRLAGEFGGMVHFEVPRENADALAESLRGLELSSGLKLVIAKSDSTPVPIGMRGVDLELVGDDRVGIVSNLTRILSEAGVSIEHIHTEVVGTTASAPRTFKIMAHLLVPNTLASDGLRRRLDAVASEMMVDIALDDHAG